MSFYYVHKKSSSLLNYWGLLFLDSFPMKYLVRALLLLCISLVAISTCISQVSLDQYHIFAPFTENQLTSNHQKRPVDYLFINSKLEAKEIYSKTYFQNIKMNTTNKFLRRSRLCVVATVALVSIYIVTKDKNENLALGSAVAALATSSLGVVYYIKARKKD